MEANASDAASGAQPLPDLLEVPAPISEDLRHQDLLRLCDTAPLYKHLQCKHGAHHHSFVFAAGEFVGDGFALEEARLAQPEFEAMISRAGARLMCQRKGDESLLGAPLRPCTQSNDGSTTGWSRTGSCNWVGLPL